MSISATPRRRMNRSDAEVVNVDTPHTDVINPLGDGGGGEVRGKKAAKKKRKKAAEERKKAVWWKPKLPWVIVWKWATVLARILLPLLFIAAPFHLIVKVGNNGGFWDTDVRIAELQYRVEFTEQKLYNLYGKEIDSRLDSLDRRADAQMDKVLGVLLSKGLLSKEEYGEFYESHSEPSKLARGQVDHAFTTAGAGPKKNMDVRIAELQYRVEVAEQKLYNLYGKEIDSRLDALDRMADAHMDDKVLGVLGVLLSKGLLSKEEYRELYESQSETPKLARGQVDHAFTTAGVGARVVRHSDPLFKDRNLTTKVHSDSAKVLNPGFGQPGDCFPLKGSAGFIQIRLDTDIIPEAVTVEHLAKSVAYDRSNAPRDFRVYGWLYGPVRAHCCDTKSNEKKLLTEFTYDLDKSNVQTFKVTDSANSVVVNMIRFDYTSNHGNPSHTCIYRLRVHGHDPSHVDAAH